MACYTLNYCQRCNNFSLLLNCIADAISHAAKAITFLFLFYFLTIFVNIKVHILFEKMLSLKHAVSLRARKQNKSNGNEIILGFVVDYRVEERDAYTQIPHENIFLKRI